MTKGEMRKRMRVLKHKIKRLRQDNAALQAEAAHLRTVRYQIRAADHVREYLTLWRALSIPPHVEGEEDDPPRS